jgi:hypothetical protein
MEQHLFLKRTVNPSGSNGRLYYNEQFICFTIELPWLNNEPQRSCIPVGNYRLLLRYSLKHKTHLVLKDVPGRQLILVHPGNDAMKELKGCIAPVTTITGQGKGTASRFAFKKVYNLVCQLMDDGPVFLTIKQTI